MSHVFTRTHSGSRAIKMLEKAVACFDANVWRVVAYVHEKLRQPNLPAPTIANCVADRCEDDDIMLAQFFGGDAHPTIISALAREIACELGELSDDAHGPSVEALEKHLGRALANSADLRLSRADKFEILRAPKNEARAIAKNRIAQTQAKARAEREANNLSILKKIDAPATGSAWRRPPR